MFCIIENDKIKEEKKLLDNQKIQKAFNEIFDNYSCFYTRSELEALPKDVQSKIAELYFKRPYDEEDPETYEIDLTLEKKIYKELNIYKLKEMLNADELRNNGINVEIDAKPPISTDYCFYDDMSEYEMEHAFDENIQTVSFTKASGEKLIVASYQDLKKAMEDSDNSFFYKSESVQNTPVQNFSSAGAEKLREIAENDETYIDFLKFQGRVFKHSTSVALEFFTQKPETKFIATKEQWEMSKRTVSQGSEAIRFIDSDNKITDYYDFSQVEETVPPYQWTVNSKNAADVKSQLNIPENVSLISGIINTTVKPSNITSCMSALGISPKDYKTFGNSYLNAIQLIIAGRLETGGNSFSISPDLTALKMLKTDSQKIAFLTYTSDIARKALMKIEKTINEINSKERNERNELREMESSDNRGTAKSSGRRTAGDTSGASGEQSDRIKSGENGRQDRLGDNSENPERQEHKVVSGIQNADSKRSEILVQVQSDMRTVHSESDRLRANDGGAADRNLRNEVDDIHGGELSSSGGGNEVVSQVSDSSSLGGQVGTGLQGTSGRTVRTGEPTSDGLRGSAEMGTGENVLLGQHSDEGNSISSVDRSIEEKLNTVFSSQETEKTSTEKADVFISNNKISDDERLVQITAEIGENQKRFADLINNGEYEKAAEISQKLTDLTQTASQLKKVIQSKPITEDDVKALRDIKPARKSVQNMLEPETARTTKFESLLDKEMGGKSPYAMRKNGGNEWRNDESQRVKVVEIQPHNLPEDIKLLRKSENVHNIPTGYFENDDTRIKILFNPDSIKETVSKAIQDNRDVSVEARMNALYHMEEIIKNAVCFDSQVSEYHPQKSKNKSPNTLFMHRMYGVFIYDDKPYLANLAVEEIYQKNAEHQIDSYQNRLYNFRDIKITPMKPGFDPRDQMPTGIGNASIGVDISISQLSEFVKTYDQSFFENPESPGRESREAELYLQAEYTDTMNADKNKSETKKQVIEFAESHNVSIHMAKKELQQIVNAYKDFTADEKKNKGFSEEKNRELEMCIHIAFDKIKEINNFTAEQSEFMSNLEKFSITNHIINNMVNSAFEKSSRFCSLYISESWVNSNIFKGNFSAIKNALNEEIKAQMELLKQEKAESKKATSEKEKESVPENIDTDLTKGIESAPQIEFSDFKIDMEDVPQLVFLKTDNSDGKIHFNETIFTYDTENVSIKIQKSFDNLDSFDAEETVSVDDGVKQIDELMKHYQEKNMHISVMHENSERESLNQYINRSSGDYPVIEAFFNNDVPEFANPQPDNKKAPKSRICTVQEYNNLLKKASGNIQDGHSFKLHFKVIMSNKRSYSETFELTKDTKMLSEILRNSENNQKYNRDFLKALKMISDIEFSENIHKAFEEIKSGHNFTDKQQLFFERLEKFVVKNHVTENMVDEFSKNPAFQNQYGSIKNLSYSVFAGQLRSLEKELAQAIKQQTADEEKIIETVQKKSADDLKVGDTIRYAGEVWKITDIKEDFSINLENTDKNSVIPVKSFFGNWKEALENDGFEYISQKNSETDSQIPVSDDDFSDIDTNEIRENLENAGIVEGKIVNEEKLNNSPFIQQVEKDVETATKTFEKSMNTENNNVLLSKRLYEKFTEMFPDIISGEHTHEHYGNAGDALEPLSVDHLGSNVYGLMTYYVQNGDLMRDPDFTFELDHKNKTLNILEYQQDGVPCIGTVYQCVYDENNNADFKMLSALEEDFMQNLNNIQNTKRTLTKFTDKIGNEFNTGAEKENSEPEEPEINDSTPELREVLNEFSKKYGLGELNVEQQEYNWKLSEKFQDGSNYTLGEITNPQYGIPFTPETLRTALERFEKSIQSRNQDISELYGRKSSAEYHGGISELPKVQENLPEISYASNPSEKIANNISAIREMIRLEEADRNGENPYDARSNQYNSRQASEHRLRQYCGWGGLPQVFDENFKQYDYYRKELKTILTPEEYQQAKASSLNAHYTPQIIIDAMYKAIKNMDLPRDAKILEPSCGTGNFISRLPHSFENAEVTGVELDSITARIAKQLNCDNENVQIVNSGFENTNLENNSFDLAIGNIPFGDYNMNDPDYVQDWKIHDAFFRKALDKVASGGVIAFVTSTGTMDKANPKIREYLAERAELIGAVRLPNNAFSDAGTKVSSDIIFLKKRETPLPKNEPKPDWCYTIPNKDGLKINSYFVKNPQMMLGEMQKTTFQDRLTCKPFEGADLEKQLNEAIKSLNAKITVSKREKAVLEKRGNIEPWGKKFTYQLKDEKIYYRNGNQMNEIKCTEAEKEKMKSLCQIRDIARKLIDLQKTSASDSELISIRESLNKAYDEYKTKYGELSSKQVKRLFGNDSDFPILQSLENYNKETGEFQKADIFFRRTVNPVLEIKSVESAEEALQVSLDRKGKPDIPYMAVLLNQNPEEVCSELLEKGYIFIDPEKEIPDKPFSGVTERSEYLSGNVRRKLAVAEEYAKTNPEYKHNADELKKVIPEDIKAEEISVQMGCAWIEPQDYAEFLEYLSGHQNNNFRKCSVNYSPITGEFEVINTKKQELNINETTTYGTADYNMYQLAEKILNQRRIAVMREKPNPKDPSKIITRTDPKATKIALEKAKLIRAEFAKWIFADPERKAKYERKYNDIFNSIIGRDYDGSHLTFSGMKNDFILRPHQKDCVARAIYGGNTLAAHVVGAGKSAVIFSSVMKKKELGLISKACVVVPKSLTEQTANEWRKIYPDAKILTVTNDDLSNEEKRKIFTAKVATGSYDAVILSQEQFEKIPMSKQYRINFMQKEIDNLEDMLREKKTESKGKKNYSVKAIEKAKKKLEVKLENLLNPKSASKAKDDLLEFEQLGFDYLVCDEAHAYKNGFVMTKMTNVSGVTTRPSGRAEDMQMKTDYFNEQFGQGHILFATGTPVSNSMTELYVMTRYLRPDLLKQAGVERFDDWAATFGKVVTKNQQAADGTLKMKTSFANFANLPELMAMYKEFADIQSAEKLHLPRPELKTGKPQIISVPATPEQKAYVRELAERARLIENGEVEPNVDNHLKITGEARLIGLGNKAIKALYEKSGKEIPYDFAENKDSKVDKCIEKVAEIYNQTNDTKGVQIIFSDVAVNSDNGNFSVYDYIKDELIAKGIPKNEIIFAPKSDSKDRENIFRDINNSKYRVVIASTSTLGTGANIQQNLYALHHIDVPWKPSDFEQREGRILRQGNKNKEVEIFNYVTEGTLDSYLYQIVVDKARFIAQLLDGKCPARVSEDCDERVLTTAEIQAAAEGNPDFKRRIELSNEIAELTMQKNNYLHETAMVQKKIERIPEEIQLKKEMLSHVQNDRKSVEKIQKLALSSLKENKDYVVMTREKINAYLLKMVQEKLNNPEKEIPPVNINNFEVSVYFDKSADEVRFMVKGESTYSCSAGASENQDNYQRISNLFEKLIPKHEQAIIEKISALEENLEQAKQRVAVPFPCEKELEEKAEEFRELDEKLSGLSVQEDIIFDPQEEIIETKEEKTQREAIYNSDEDDYQPTENNDNPITR